MTAGGLSWRSAWGVLRYSANVAQLAMVHSTWAYANGDSPYAAALFNYGQSQVCAVFSSCSCMLVKPLD